MKIVTHGMYSNRTVTLAVLSWHFRQYQFIASAFLQLLRIAERHCPMETHTHAARVGAYAAEIYATWATQHHVAQASMNSRKEMLRVAAMLHDIGKIAIPSELLHKAERLTDDEYARIQRHTVLGARFFQHAQSEFGQMVAQVALNHHERWDGSGYPGYVDPTTGKILAGYERQAEELRGKRGADIPQLARIVAVADVYDALSSRRVYKAAWQERYVLEQIERESAQCFDLDVTTAFFASLDTIYAISRKFPEVMSSSGNGGSRQIRYTGW
jgi:HD-GYP domain-containing protein (c-di-GMP phosphodiesterase class II)